MAGEDVIVMNFLYKIEPAAGLYLLSRNANRLAELFFVVTGTSASRPKYIIKA